MKAEGPIWGREKKKKSCGELSPSTFQDSNHIQSSLTNPNTWRGKNKKTQVTGSLRNDSLDFIKPEGENGINESTSNKKLSSLYLVILWEKNPEFIEADPRFSPMNHFPCKQASNTSFHPRYSNKTRQWFRALSSPTWHFNSLLFEL